MAVLQRGSIQRPLSEINVQTNEKGYKEHRVILEMQNLSTSKAYQRTRPLGFTTAFPPFTAWSLISAWVSPR